MEQTIQHVVVLMLENRSFDHSIRMHGNSADAAIGAPLRHIIGRRQTGSAGPLRI